MTEVNDMKLCKIISLGKGSQILPKIEPMPKSRKEILDSRWPRLIREKKMKVLVPLLNSIYFGRHMFHYCLWMGPLVFFFSSGGSKIQAVKCILLYHIPSNGTEMDLWLVV